MVKENSRFFKFKEPKNPGNRSISPVTTFKSLFKKDKPEETKEDDPKVVSIDVSTGESTPRTEGEMTQNETSDEEGCLVR